MNGTKEQICFDCCASCYLSNTREYEDGVGRPGSWAFIRPDRYTGCAEQLQLPGLASAGEVPQAYYSGQHIGCGTCGPILGLGGGAQGLGAKKLTRVERSPACEAQAWTGE